MFGAGTAGLGSGEMEELKSLVLRARTGDLDAYGELVGRFQDMAYGYAFSILGDFIEGLKHNRVDSAAHQCLGGFAKRVE